MDLFEWSQNIMKVNQNKVISDSIKNVNDEMVLRKIECVKYIVVMYIMN